MHSIIHKLYILASAICFSIPAFTQQVPTVPYQSIPALSLEVSTRQTSVIIFPTAIKSIDRGNGNIITKTIKEIGNVLKVKAATDSFQCTNMHVFTADGNIYSFEVSYRISPANPTLDLTGRQQPYSGYGRFSSARLNEAQIESYAELISQFAPVHHRPHSKWKGLTRIESTGIYQSKGILFFQFRLLNASAVPYEIDFARSYVRDKKRPKRSSITEKEITPVHQKYTPSEVAPCHISVILLAFDRFTIADNKYFIVEVFEKNGDRYLSCKLKGRDILRALSPTLSESNIRSLPQP